MVILYVLGTIDLLAAASLAAMTLGYPLPQLQAAMALFLIGKGIFYIKDFLSILDIAIGISMFALFWFTSPILALSLAVYLAFKGAYSFA